MRLEGKTYYLFALLCGLVLHSSILYFTFGNTYDAYVHIFFAEHYAENWFENWSYKWYTGFTITSYPPLVHQVIALLSTVVGLKFGFFLWGVLIVLVFIRGVYHFSKLWVDELTAGYAALLAVVSTSFVEALHVFGQLPSITGVAFLLNACPEIYSWIRTKSKFRLLTSLSLLAVITSAHHVTTIFGMVFFIFPVIALALLDNAIIKKGSLSNVKLLDFIKELRVNFFRLLGLGVAIICITLVFIFAYWYWSKTDPISQVPIPHGSRDNFLEILSSGLVFFLIPWATILFFLPPLLLQVFRKRNIFLGLSFATAFILGTGGTTPIPRLVLGETAFNILTLDRFTFWGSIMILPFLASIARSIISGDIFHRIKSNLGELAARGNALFVLLAFLISAAFIFNINAFRPLQPDSIDVKPIVNFLNRDNHDRWRYLTLGFGDQVAWLSANTNAKSVDGNYHSVRRLPEFTVRSVERLENAKYQGMQGIGALQQFLTTPEKYNLKFVFSNDKFYEPVLYFSGWNRVQQLENNIVLWENPDIKPLPSILPRKEIPTYQKYMWGILPLTSLFLIAFCYILYWIKIRNKSSVVSEPPIQEHKNFQPGKYWYLVPVYFIVSALMCFALLANLWRTNQAQFSPENVLSSYYDALDFKEFEKAFSYLKGDKLTLEQFLLENTLEDGILASYAKLSDLSFETISVNPSSTTIRVTSKWVTSLNDYITKKEHRVIKVDNKWYVEHQTFDKKTSPDQFFNNPILDFKNQGRRKAVAGKTRREDELDRPSAYVYNTKLMQIDTNYHIVGEIINVDNDPLYLTVEAALFDKYQNEIIRYNAKDIMKHNLLPKESTPFRIDFEEAFDQIIKFDPKQELERVHTFAIFIKTMSTDTDFYPFVGVQSARRTSSGIAGEIINYGTNQISIPQILTNYYNEDDELIWVDNLYLSSGLRPQRKKPFNIELPSNFNDIKIITAGTDKNLLINGMSRSVSQPDFDIPIISPIRYDNIKMTFNINPFISENAK